MRILVVSPSLPFADIDLGEAFFQDGKRYILLYRDPWKVKIARYTKLDEFVANALDAVVQYTKRKTK